MVPPLLMTMKVFLSKCEYDKSEHRVMNRVSDIFLDSSDISDIFRYIFYLHSRGRCHRWEWRQILEETPRSDEAGRYLADN